MIKKTFRDLAFYFPVIAIQGTFGLVTAAIVTKLFSPQDYGRYVLAFAFYSQLVLFTSLWLQFSIIRFAPYYRARGRFDEFASTLLFAEIGLVCCFVLVLPFVLSAVVKSADRDLSLLLIPALAGALILPFVSAIEQFYRIDDRPKRYCCMVLFRILSGPAIGLVLAKVFGLGMPGFFIGVVALHLFLFGLFLYMKRRRVIVLLQRGSISFTILKEILLYSAPGVALSTVASSLVFSDRYLIAWYSGAHDLAVYTIAYIIGNQGIELITSVLLGAGEPIAIRMWEKEGPAKAHLYLGELLRYYSLLAIPAVIGLAVLGRLLIPVLSTRSYVEGWPVIGYVALGVLLCGYSQILSRIFFFRKQTVTPLIIFAIAAGANILLNIVLIPRFGYIAAAWSTLAGYFLLLLMISLVGTRSVSIGFSYRACFRMAGSGLLMGLLLYLIRDAFVSPWLNLGVCLMGGVSLYLLALIVAGEIDAREVRDAFRSMLFIFKSIVHGRKTHSYSP